MPRAVMQVLHNVQVEYPDQLKKEILASIGNIEHIEVFGQEVLVAAFVVSPYFASGRLLRGDKDQDEDKWQSKSFMILKMGAEAQAYSDKRKIDLESGQWCFGNVQEQWQLSVRGRDTKPLRDEQTGQLLRPWGEGGWPCRLILVGDIRGRTTRPQDVI